MNGSSGRDDEREPSGGITRRVALGSAIGGTLAAGVLGAAPTARAAAGGPGTAGGGAGSYEPRGRDRAPGPAPSGAYRATSPDGDVEAFLWAARDGLHWAVRYQGQTLVDDSPLGLTLANGTVLGAQARVGRPMTRVVHDTWSATYGRNAQVDADFCELSLPCTQAGYAFSVVVRAYAAGAAVCYELTGAPGGTVTLAGEQTGFTFPAGTVIYGSRDEDQYLLCPPASIPDSGSSTTDSGPLFDNPVTAVLPDGGLACVCEANRAHYPRLMFASDGDTTIVSHLMQFAGRQGTAGAVPTFSLSTPASTPWRAVVAGADGVDLLAHCDLVASLAAPSVVGDVSWVRPGKAFRVGTLTTQAGLDGVDFAAAQGMAYIEFDAGWYGPETSPSSDPTQPIAAIDLPQVISYAKGKGVGLILYVNRIALSDPDSLFSVYQQWGVAGLKLGFILDGTQAQTDQIIGFATAAAKYQLVLNQHDDLRPLGQERTYPNWLNMEGVRGNEHFPTATHNVILPFCRNLAGPMDYTPCIGQSRDQTTDAHQTAMSVVYYQPLEFLYWYSVPSQYSEAADYPELAFLKAVPTVWDESRPLLGEIGEYVVIARRSGADWYVGAMTNVQGRVLQVPLDFLGSGAWTATIYADGGPTGWAGTTPFATPVVTSSQSVTASTTLTMTLAPSGGQAIYLTRS